jgi:NADPH-dependent curcumin reductase CurA
VALTWILKERPNGALRADIFALEERPDAPLAEGMVRVRNLWASVDPYMRGLLDGEGSYVPAIPLDQPMHGGAVGKVIESRAPEFPIGAHVIHNDGWREVSSVSAAECLAIDASEDIPLEHYLGNFGMPGMTAYFGLLHAGAAQPGETLFVSSAAGAVGSAVVQIAKASGMRVIGSAGGPEKCAAVHALGADAMIDYKQGDLSRQLAAAAPDGIDAYFDNVGSDHLAAALDNARMHMRITVCGMISGYGGKADLVIAEPMRLVAKRIRLHGHFAPDYYPQRAKFHADMRGWYRSGALTCPVRIYDGLASMPEAFLSLYRGGTVGKVVVRLP